MRFACPAFLGTSIAHPSVCSRGRTPNICPGRWLSAVEEERMRKLVVIAVAFLFFAILVAGMGTAWGQSAIQPGTASGAVPAAEKDKKGRVEDVTLTERADQFRISPDSKWAVWVKLTPDADKDGMVSNLF